MVCSEEKSSGEREADEVFMDVGSRPLQNNLKIRRMHKIHEPITIGCRVKVLGNLTSRSADEVIQGTNEKYQNEHD